MKELTPKEAIRELSYDNTAYGGKCTKEVRETAINALEKQIPKKPGEKESTEKTRYLCPNCEYNPITIYADGYRLGNKPKYCEKCGQAIDWSE